MLFMREAVGSRGSSLRCAHVMMAGERKHFSARDVKSAEAPPSDPAKSRMRPARRVFASPQLSAISRKTRQPGQEMRGERAGREWQTGNGEPRMENGVMGRAFVPRFGDAQETLQSGFNAEAQGCASPCRARADADPVGSGTGWRVDDEP
jgi:hypothetical protein